jgi:hypothetical protein
MIAGDIGKSSIAALVAALTGAAMLVAPMLLAALGVAAFVLAVCAGLDSSVPPAFEAGRMTTASGSAS